MEVKIMMGHVNDVQRLADKDATIAALEARVKELELQSAANRNLAVANGERAREEDARAEAAEKRVKELEEALLGITDHYVNLVNSGDAGFWNPEDDDEVIAARSALKGGQ